MRYKVDRTEADQGADQIEQAKAPNQVIHYYIADDVCIEETEVYQHQGKGNSQSTIYPAHIHFDMHDYPLSI